jgi:hypothetical protein
MGAALRWSVWRLGTTSGQDEEVGDGSRVLDEDGRTR